MPLRITDILTILASGEDGGASVYDIFASIFAGIDQRLAAVEDLSGSLVALQTALAQSADAIVDAALDPVVSAIQGKASLGAILTAESVSEATVSTGLKTFVISPEASRPMFAPAHMLTVTATDNPSLTMYGRQVSYDVENGTLVVEVLASAGTGTLTSWTIAPGSLAAMANVISVAAVSGEIAGPSLQSALEQIDTALAARQPFSDVLSAIAGLDLIADRIIGTDGAGNPVQFAASAYGKTLLAMASAETLRTGLQAAPLASPAFTGTPTAPTPSIATDSNQIANVTALRAAVSALVNSSPAALDTLKELATALGNDANFATTMTNALAGKQPLAAALTALAASSSGSNKVSLMSALGAAFGGPAPTPGGAGLGLFDGTFNEVTAPGIYTITGIWSDGPYEVGLASYSGLLEVRKRSSGFYVQIFRATSGRVFRRVASSTSSWGGWVTIEMPTLGTVAQSSGEPTGSIIERGSNANGEYVRFADGTQICTKTLTGIGPIDSAHGSMYASAGVNISSWAASFADVPVRSLAPNKSGTGSLAYYGTTPTTAAGGIFYLLRPVATAATDFAVQVTAIGRWF